MLNHLKLYVDIAFQPFGQYSKNKYKKMWYKYQCDNSPSKSQFVNLQRSSTLRLMAHTQQLAKKVQKNDRKKICI